MHRWQSGAAPRTKAEGQASQQRDACPRWLPAPQDDKHQNRCLNPPINANWLWCPAPAGPNTFIATTLASPAKC
jgi:hypothetical protein